MKPQLYLASRSPRRAELLQQLGLRFEVVRAEVAELRLPGQTPADYARATALAKAQAGAAQLGAQRPRLPVLGADTDVAIDGDILGKPRDAEDAVRMLLRLAERSHQVFSAVALVSAAGADVELSVTRVQFGAITRAQALDYWNSGEPADKAGAYAIQGHAARWICAIEGSYSGVVGLPLFETVWLLERHGVQLGAASTTPAETAA
ncbi:MAG: septum formation inhibitor Maf [Nevskia sp.]|nr:septum formation inhibitor Maf [Nevskia sp.]